MLPDFLKFKEHQAQEFAAEVTAGRGLVGQIRKVVIHEGEGFVTLRADGSSTRQGMVRLEAKVEVTKATIQSGDPAALKKVLSELQQTVSGKQDKMLLERVSEAAASVGNVLDAGGKPLTAELILENMKQIELSFDDAGNWDIPTMVVSPAMATRAQQELRRLFEDPDLKRQVDEVVEAGRKRWSDREANRKLVD